MSIVRHHDQIPVAQVLHGNTDTWLGKMHLVCNIDRGVPLEAYGLTPGSSPDSPLRIFRFVFDIGHSIPSNKVLWLFYHRKEGKTRMGEKRI